MNQPSIEGLSIRFAHRRDVIQCLRIQLDALRLLCASDYSSLELEALVEQKICFASSANRHRQLTWVAEQDGIVVGLAARFGWCITALCVHPQCVRQGIGSQLLGVLEDSARIERFKALMVNSSLTARPFYQSHNYKILQDSNFVTQSRVRIPCIQMKKALFPLPQGEGE